ncbi:hypothetical protein CHUAL_007678 [Chamberlinius hualienensis]
MSKILFSILLCFIAIGLISDSVEAASAPCPVPLIWSPVCGNDNRTYGNIYELRCEQRERPGLKKKHNGPCKKG